MESPGFSRGEEVNLEKDAEGNGYSPLATAYEGWYEPDSTYSGHVYGDDDAVTAAQVAENDTLRDGVEQGELHLVDDGDLRCLVLGPVN